MEENSSSGFEEFYRAHFEQVVKAAYLVVGSAEEAFDVAQESFARTWAAWDRIERRDQPIVFTYRVAVNLGRTSVRRLVKLRSLTALLSPRDQEQDPSGHVAARVTVQAAMRKLPARQRWAVALCDLADLSSDDAARVLRISPSTLRVHLARGRERLRTTLNDTDSSDPGEAYA